MKHRRTLIYSAVVLGLLAVICFLWPAYTGPGVNGNLIFLEVAKTRWARDHHTETEWPTKSDLRPYMESWSLRSRHGEIYIINKIGSPVYAYEPRTERLISIDSNDQRKVQFYLDQKK